MKRKILFTMVAFSAALFFVSLIFEFQVIKLITKLIPLLCLIFLLSLNDKYSRLVFLGLVFSVIGDLLLELPFDLFTFGLLSFLIAHLFYIFAFNSRAKSFGVIALIISFAFGTVVFLFLKQGLGDMIIPVIVYMSVILVMSWRAFMQRNFDKYSVWAFVGAIFFLFSDLNLAFCKFTKSYMFSAYVIMATYWIGQFLIFYSAYKQKLESYN